jgi:hypothetical protein
VQAGEVRRRLEQYYQSVPNPSAVRIELHVGSYSPEFKWAQPVPNLPQSSLLHAAPDDQETPQGLGNGRESSQFASPSPTETKTAAGKHRRLVWVLSAAGVVVLAGFALLWSGVFHARAPQTVLQKFWSPAMSSPEPVLICLAKPSVYLPSIGLYQRHSKTPEEFLGQYERLSQKPDLQPGDKLVWSDMVEYPDYGLAAGDVYTAIQVSALLGQIGKKSHVRIGGNYSFQDLRNSPAVVIGAFNNRWTMQMTANLHFAFVEEGAQSVIREEGPSGRRWSSGTEVNGKAIEDYAVVTRLLNSKTGQFVLFVAGIRSYGTQAAGEFVSTPEYLQKALQAAPADWEGKNVQIVLHTTVIDGLSGPPQVIATYVW